MLFFPISAHSPDNSFAGFVVDAATELNEEPMTSTAPKALVYGKDGLMWKV